jgi:hypothetical protein
MSASIRGTKRTRSSSTSMFSTDSSSSGSGSGEKYVRSSSRIHVRTLDTSQTAYRPQFFHTHIEAFFTAIKRWQEVHDLSFHKNRIDTLLLLIGVLCGDVNHTEASTVLLMMEQQVELLPRIVPRSGEYQLGLDHQARKDCEQILPQRELSRICGLFFQSCLFHVLTFPLEDTPMKVSAMKAFIELLQQPNHAGQAQLYWVQEGEEFKMETRHFVKMQYALLPIHDVQDIYQYMDARREFVDTNTLTSMYVQSSTDVTPRKQDVCTSSSMISPMFHIDQWVKIRGRKLRFPCRIVAVMNTTAVKVSFFGYRSCYNQYFPLEYIRDEKKQILVGRPLSENQKVIVYWGGSMEQPIEGEEVQEYLAKIIPCSTRKKQLVYEGWLYRVRFFKSKEKEYSAAFDEWILPYRLLSSTS